MPPLPWSGPLAGTAIAPGVDDQTVVPMMPTTTPTETPSLTARHQAELVATRVRGDDQPDGEPHGVRSQLRVLDGGRETAALPGLPTAAADPLASTARVSGQLDRQGRLSCKKLLASLGWQPRTELTAALVLERPLLLIRREVDDGVDLDGGACDCERCVSERRAATALDAAWQATHEPVAVTGKWELQLPAGLRHHLGVEAPGEVLALGLPAVDGLLLTSAAYAVAALVDGIALTATG